MIEIKEGRYYVGLWNFPFGRRGDWMGCLWHEADKPTDWIFEYRFRYYADAKAFASEDEKNWYRATLKGQEAKIIGEVKALIAKFAAMVGSSVDFFEVMGDQVVFEEKLAKNKPKWMHSSAPLN